MLSSLGRPTIPLRLPKLTGQIFGITDRDKDGELLAEGMVLTTTWSRFKATSWYRAVFSLCGKEVFLSIKSHIWIRSVGRVAVQERALEWVEWF